MNFLHPMQRLIVCLGAGVLGITTSCSSAPGKSASHGSLAGDGGHGAAPDDAATGVAAAPQGAGGSAGRGLPGPGTSGGSSGVGTTGGSSGVATDAGGSGSTTPPGGGSSCSAILSCVQACADDACAQGCVNQGSASAQDLVNALLDCATQYGCSDAACLQTNCASEASACLSDGQSTGAQDGGAPPMGTGAIPTDLVGTWVSSDQGITYVFNADGTYEYHFHYSSGLTCILYLSRRIDETGTVSVQGDTLTTTGTSRTTATQECNYHTSNDTGAGETQTFTYALSGGTLTLTDSNGTQTLARQ